MVKAHGLAGEVVVEFFTPRPERTAPGTRYATDRGELELVSARPFAGRLPNRFLARFAGVGDRAGADRLHGAPLYAEPLGDTDALWVHELVGAAVTDPSGRPLGTVAAVVANPASDLLEMEDGGLIPLRFVVDHRPGLVVVEVPEGLLGG